MSTTESAGARPVEDLARVDVVFELLTGAVGGLDESEARGPSRLPGWTRGHVLTHLARNADGQRNLVEGVLVDEVRDQYPGGDEQRSRDIEAGADRPIAALLADLVASQRALVDAWSRVPDGAWDRLTRARVEIRPVRAGVISRWREIAAHLVDLDVGVAPDQLPRDYLDDDAAWIAQHRPDW
jgi:maleylpyruvate isomerase